VLANPYLPNVAHDGTNRHTGPVTSWPLLMLDGLTAYALPTPVRVREIHRPARAASRQKPDIGLPRRDAFQDRTAAGSGVMMTEHRAAVRARGRIRRADVAPARRAACTGLLTMNVARSVPVSARSVAAS
jgi:hypothetical protein